MSDGYNHDEANDGVLGTAGGGVVTVTLTASSDTVPGSGTGAGIECSAVHVDPSAIDAEDPSLLEDLVMAAINDGLGRIEPDHSGGGSLSGMLAGLSGLSGDLPSLLSSALPALGANLPDLLSGAMAAFGFAKPDAAEPARAGPAEPVTQTGQSPRPADDNDRSAAPTVPHVQAEAPPWSAPQAQVPPQADPPR